MSDVKAMFDEAVRRHRAGQLAEAEQGYRAILDIDAGHAASWHGLGTLALRTNRFDAAADLIAKAIALDGTVARYHFNLGVARQRLGQGDAAEASYRQAIALKPELAEAHVNLAGVLERQGRTDDAIAYYEQALALGLESAAVRYALGNALRSRGRRQDAIAHYRRAAALKPRDDILRDLAAALLDQGEAGEALSVCTQAISARPDFHATYALKGNILFRLGQPEDAAAAYRQALALKPSSPSAYSNLLFTLSYAQLLPPADILAVARGFEDAVCRPPEKPFIGRLIDTAAKLRVGFLSAEVGMHAAASFFETYLRHYDRAKIEVWLYSTTTFRDARRDRLLSLVDHAVDLDGVGNDAARDRIIADGIHILVETTSHTSHGRLPMLAQRCAPIQCSYFGYFGTTGVRAIDYFVGDNEVSPPESGWQFSERLVQLPDVWMVYTPAEPLPEPESWSGDDEIVLGSFNTFAKIRPGVLDLWSRLLLEIPAARLLLKDKLSVDPVSRARILSHIAAKGADPGRVEFLPNAGAWADHMALYNRIDIALDTFPFGSCTTGFDALYMGTPLVAMRGRLMTDRMASSMVKALGRPEWVAEDADAYVAIVRRLAADKPALRRLKTTLRAEMMKSPVGDGPRFARALEAAFYAMVDAYNAGDYPRA